MGIVALLAEVPSNREKVLTMATFPASGVFIQDAFITEVEASRAMPSSMKQCFDPKASVANS